MAGEEELDPGFLTHLRPVVAFYEKTWDAYTRDRSNTDELIAACRRDLTTCSPRFQAWVKLIDLINETPATKYERLDLVDKGINSMLTYDNGKASGASVLFHSGNWLQNPQQTLITNGGTGICGDYAVLKYETLKRVGFSDSELRLVGGMKPGFVFHTALMATADGRNYVLDPPNAIHDATAAPTPDYDYVKGYIEPTTKMLHSGFVPVVNFNDSGFHVYGAAPNQAKADATALALRDELPRPGLARSTSGPLQLKLLEHLKAEYGEIVELETKADKDDKIKKSLKSLGRPNPAAP